MKLPGFLRGAPQVARQEFVGNLRSVRMLIMVFVAALLIVGGSYGASALFSGFNAGAPPIAVWGHPAYGAGGEHIAVVWVSDPYGAPRADVLVEFSNVSANREVLGQVRTDPNGFAKFDVGTLDVVAVSVRVGTYESGSGVAFLPFPTNFTAEFNLWDLDNNGIRDDLAVQVLNRSGDPAAARILVNGTDMGAVDGHGYKDVKLPQGDSNVTVEVGGDNETTRYTVEAGGLPFATGPDFVLTITASLSGFAVSIFAIVIAFDAITKERVQGTMDLLLSRPASRTGVLLGKFGGAWAAVAVPVTLVNLAGVGAVSLASGKGPTWGFVGAFLGDSLLLIAFYVLMMLIFSTLAKTSGTAVLFGLLLWLLLNLLYPFLTLALGLVFFSGNPAGMFRFVQVADLGNPSSIYGDLVALASPVRGAGLGLGTTLDAASVGAAAVFWFVLLLAQALWTFHRRATD